MGGKDQLWSYMVMLSYMSLASYIMLGSWGSRDGRGFDKRRCLLDARPGPQRWHGPAPPSLWLASGMSSRAWTAFFASEEESGHEEALRAYSDEEH